MNEEEKKAIEMLESFEPDDLFECAIYRNALEKINNLINKQHKIIDLMINDLKEYVYTNQCKEEILEFYKNM